LNERLSTAADGKPQKQKVVLLFPNPLEETSYSLEIPLAILAVAAPLYADGYQVILIDERLHDDPEKAILEAAEGALCVGVSTITGSQLKGAVRFSRLIKDRLPGMPIVWGGYHPSLLPEQCAAESFVDVVVRGQGERTFQELVLKFENGEGFDDVAGVTYRNDSGETINNPDRPMDEVNSFPPAPYDLLDIEHFFQLNGGRRALQYISSQGCPFKCTFCVEPKVFGKWSGRSAEKIIEEIAVLYNRYQVNHVTFSDPNFFVNRKRVETMCHMLIDKGIRISWSAAARADQVIKISPEFARLIKDSGCSQIGIGIESGSQTILDLIDKRTSPEKAIRSNEILEHAGIQGCYAFMVGFPKQLDESENEIMQTLMLIKRMRQTHPDVITVTFYVTPYPGTPIYDIAINLKLKMPLRTEEWANWESTSVQTTWITDQERDLVERCNSFYFPFAYPNEIIREKLSQLKWKPLLYPLHWMAAVRCKLNFYGFPMEWKLMQRLVRINRLRKFGSQMDALRGF